MPRTWIEPQKITVPEQFSQSVGGNPLTIQMLYSRGITDIETAKGFLNPMLYKPTSGLQLPGMEKLTAYLYQAILENKKIGIWGDFDVDGQTATTILVSGLQDLGADVVYHIPIRAVESHGITIQALEKFLLQEVDVLLTCDTGITAHEAIDYAHLSGILVLVSDHHDLPASLPNAEAIVNPKMLPADHPLSTLPGAGVAYKIIEQLYTSFGVAEKASKFLDLVALGIVADLALLTGDTRYLLQTGLDALRSTERIGLISMMELAELKQSNLTEEHISFIIAPRMNAVGRLDDANLIVELLTTTDPGRARILAILIEGMNAQRKLLTDQVYQAALSQLTTQPKMLESPAIVLSHSSWPAGVIGIVASRLVDQYHRPVILFSSPPGEDAHGSARSVEGVNITNLISTNQLLVKTFGGHPMAAGLAIDPANIPQFRAAIENTLHNMGVEYKTGKKLQIDAYVSLPELTLSLVDDLERMAPFGPGNRSLVLAAQNLSLTGYSAIGRNDDHLQLTIEDEMGHTFRSIWWQAAGNKLPDKKFDLAFSVRTSSYQGQREVQIEWVDFRLHESPNSAVEAANLSTEIIDFRHEQEPERRLNQILSVEKCLVWGECADEHNIACLERSKLYPEEVLAIWTIPPGNDELLQAIRIVKPRKIYLFGVNPGMDNPEAFLKRLMGLLKYCLKNTNGITAYTSLAAACAQKIEIIKLGLRWLVANGNITISGKKGDMVHVAVGESNKHESLNSASIALQAALSESAAYRRYYLTAEKTRLLSLK